MSNPQSPESVRDKTLRESKKHKQHRSIHAEKHCPNPPMAPADVQLTFQPTEEKTTLNFSPKVKWPAVLRDEQGHMTTIDHYVVQMVATSGGNLDANGMGPAVELEDGKPRLREMQKKPPKQGDQPDDYFIIYPIVPRPRTWYWQARVVAVDAKGCEGDYTPWSAQKLPWADTRSLPPTPNNVVLSFDTVERGRHDRYRALVVFDEVKNWDIPGGDHNDDVAGYAVELQSGRNPIVAGGGNANTTFDGPDRVKHRDAQDGESGPGGTKDAQRTCVFEKVSKHYFYRARVRSIDRWNRRGQWSAWFPSGALANIGVTPSDTLKPPAPTNVDLNMNSHQARITWDELIDPETGILHQDVAWFEVQLSKNSGFGTVNYRDTYVLSQHKVFKLDKPKGNWFARVRAIDSAGNQSAWSALATDTPRKPPVVGNIRIDFILQEPKKWNKVKARVRWDAVQEQSDDIAFYIVEMESGDVVGGNPADTYTKDGNRWKGHVKSPEVVDDTGTLEASETTYSPDNSDRRLQWMHDAKRGHFYRVRVRAVDKDGQASDWGPNAPQGWTNHGTKCSPANARVLKKPGTPNTQNDPINFASPKGVGMKWQHPLDQDGFPDESIDYFHVQLATSAPDAVTGFPAGSIQEDDNYVHARRAVYPIDASWSNTTGPYWIAVQSVDHVGNTSDWAFQSTNGVPASVTPQSAALGPGDINDTSFFGGDLLPVHSGPTLPNLPQGNKYPPGSPFYLTADVTGPNGLIRGQRFYWVIDTTGNSGQFGNGWDNRVFLGDANGAVDGGANGKSQIQFESIVGDRIAANTITADRIAANFLWGNTFTVVGGGSFRTDVPPNSRVQMAQVDGPDNLSFYNGTSTNRNNGRVYFQPAVTGAADLVDLVVPTNAAAPRESGLRWGNGVPGGNTNANSRLLNNGAIQLGQNSLTIGPADTNTVRIFYDPNGGANGHGGVIARKGTNTDVNLGSF